MPQTNSRSRSARLSTDDAKPARRVKRKSSRSKRPKGIAGYWVEIGMLVLVAAFLCPVVLYNLVNRIPASGPSAGEAASLGNTLPKNATLTPTESFFTKSNAKSSTAGTQIAPLSAQRSESNVLSRFNTQEVLPPERQSKLR
ncbi:MAG: hypothetical protein NTW52_05510 [Planctomycetota bacterium]|nr:hypothetical protein [Planctomycetota bacterium]